jgi:diketogulonate reductase-like aldo/keto reductase
MAETHDDSPHFVQNRCLARTGWNRDVRRFCRERKIIYQGFSLLTANVEVLHHPLVSSIAARTGSTLAQVVFAFARDIEILPLTGTTDATHMKQDLESLNLPLSVDEITKMESLGG